MNSYFNDDALSESDQESYFYRDLNAVIPRDLPLFRDPLRRKEMRNVCIERMDSLIVLLVRVL